MAAASSNGLNFLSEKRAAENLISGILSGNADLQAHSSDLAVRNKMEAAYRQLVLDAAFSSVEAIAFLKSATSAESTAELVARAKSGHSNARFSPADEMIASEKKGARVYSAPAQESPLVQSPAEITSNHFYKKGRLDSAVSPLVKHSSDARTNEKFLKMTFDDVQVAAKTGKVKSTEAFYANNISPTYVVELENGMVGVFKPEALAKKEGLSELSGAANEVGASLVDEYFGLGLVPKTVFKEVMIDGRLEKGSFQLLVPKTKKLSALPTAKHSTEEATKLDLLDALTVQTDRHGQNYLIDRNGKYVAIDNGANFQNGKDRLASASLFRSQLPNYSVLHQFRTLESSDARAKILLQNPASLGKYLRAPEQQKLLDVITNAKKIEFKDFIFKKVPDMDPKAMEKISQIVDAQRKKILDLYLEDQRITEVSTDALKKLAVPAFRAETLTERITNQVLRTQTFSKVKLTSEQVAELSSLAAQAKTIPVGLEAPAEFQKLRKAMKMDNIDFRVMIDSFRGP